MKYTSSLNSWWTQSIYLKHTNLNYFLIIFIKLKTLEVKISLKVYLNWSILHISCTEVHFKYSSISGGQNTNRSLHNLWNSCLVVRVQVYQTKDHRFKIIKWLKNCHSPHPAKDNLMSIKDAFQKQVQILKWSIEINGPSKKGPWFSCKVYLKYTSEVQLKYT